MHTRQHLISQHQELAHSHRQHAHTHYSQAQAHHHQALYHHQQAQFHHNQAMAHASGVGAAVQTPYDERHTAYHNQVSPVALVYHGSVSPQAMSSLHQFHHPYTANRHYSSPASTSLAPHAAHATENRNAMM